MIFFSVLCIRFFLSLTYVRFLLFFPHNRTSFSLSHGNKAQKFERDWKLPKQMLFVVLGVHIDFSFSLKCFFCLHSTVRWELFLCVDVSLRQIKWYMMKNNSKRCNWSGWRTWEGVDEWVKETSNYFHANIWHSGYSYLATYIFS